MLNLAFAGIAALFFAQAAPAPAPAAPPRAEVLLWRLDCGNMVIPDFANFADDFRYNGRRHEAVASCYLIKHGDQYLLWDAGLSGALIDRPVTQGPFQMRLARRITDQLAQLGVTPAQVKMVGISHYHDDHTGQLADFPTATLLIGTGDWEAVRNAQPAGGVNTVPFRHWLTGGGRVEPVRRDRDIFGDGSVTMLATPGHTPGHAVLMVRLARKGVVLLTGDLWHAAESYRDNVVPRFNVDRADTLASFDRFKAIVRSQRATVVIQHEPADIGKLPAFPQHAR